MIHGYGSLPGPAPDRRRRLRAHPGGCRAGWPATPVPSTMARPLVESSSAPSVCAEHDIQHYILDPVDGLTPYERAVELMRIQYADVRTSWSGSSVPGALERPAAPGDLISRSAARPSAIDAPGERGSMRHRHRSGV
ncbi:MAG: hypothetical protein U0S36_13830 [Candidatus Nanopelagicales bacterium]